MTAAATIVSPTELEEIAGLEIAPLGIAVGEPVADRRRSERQEKPTTAWLSAAATARQGNGNQVKVRDLSLHGVGLISDRPMQRHDTHWLVIADQSLRLSTRLRIVSSRQREDGEWDVGGEFF
ncbi:MAG: PilZ domain-containing protein [Burkholderiales bacterium]|nr:PilZ domain-containing protein [Phycisphaerae bacterium]